MKQPESIIRFSIEFETKVPYDNAKSIKKIKTFIKAYLKDFFTVEGEHICLDIKENGHMTYTNTYSTKVKINEK